MSGPVPATDIDLSSLTAFEVARVLLAGFDIGAAVAAVMFGPGAAPRRPRLRAAADDDQFYDNYGGNDYA